MVSEDNSKVSKTPQTGGGVKADMPKAIMTKPLPQILDEIEASIGLADEAAKDARKASEEARKAGEKAANEAARVAAEAITKVEQLAELLNSTLKEAAALVQKRLS